MTSHSGRVVKRSIAVSGTDKAKNKVDDLGGKAKEAAGNLTGDKSTRDEGRADQAKSSLKDAGEKIKDAFKK
ncbi:general stress protein CsbD [Mycobacterium holsaticum DSM 44478]|nr:general stress protein CsbD [Mycolicibacterium holsaticum DSM 44478 = JCM 12374]